MKKIVRLVLVMIFNMNIIRDDIKKVINKLKDNNETLFYLKDGNNYKITYLGKDKEPIKTSLGYAISIRSFDEDGRIIQELSLISTTANTPGRARMKSLFIIHLLLRTQISLWAQEKNLI